MNFGSMHKHGAVLCCGTYSVRPVGITPVVEEDGAHPSPSPYSHTVEAQTKIIETLRCTEQVYEAAMADGHVRIWE